MPRNRQWLCAIALPLFVSTSSSASDCAFWVWNRRDPLLPAERSQIAELGAALLWHAGEAETQPESGLRWKWRSRPPESGAVPVIRLLPNGADPFAVPGLAVELATLMDGGGHLQIDYDCPDRLLPEYAKFLGELRRLVPHLSITALAGWSGNAAFDALQRSVESMDVMFYDLVPDPARIDVQHPPLPLLDRAVFTQQLATWRTCQTPWRAGLPNFTRLTVFDAEGITLGHIRNWHWDEVLFQPKLRLIVPPMQGVALFSADADLTIAKTPVKAGHTIAVRWVEPEQLQWSLDAIPKSGARGPIFFRLPGSSNASGWSLPQLSAWIHAQREHPRLMLRREKGQLILTNHSNADLPPRITGNNDRGYALELDAPGRVWREALAGDFALATAHADPDTAPAAVPVVLATRLTFWFADLRAGESMETGLIGLAPGTDWTSIRYRVLGTQDWKPLQ